jgi:hypothetical protein
MSWTIAIILALMWMLGMVSSHTMGGFIHVLLILAVALLVARTMKGRVPEV